MWGCGGGILLFSPTVWAGLGGERRETHRNTHTHTRTYTRMLHLPFSDLPLKKCPITGDLSLNLYRNFWRLRPLGEVNSCVAKTFLRLKNRKQMNSAIVWGQMILLGVSRWSPFLKSIRVFSVVGLAVNSDQ